MSVDPIIVHVTYHGSGAQMQLSSSVTELNSGQAIKWEFHNVPDSLLAFVYFFPVPHNPISAQSFGPFQYLEPATHSVVGIGNTGHIGEYPYAAMVLDGNSALATVAGIVHNRSSEDDTSPDALVRFHHEEPGAPTLLVDPFTLRLEYGRTAIWYIEGLPDDHFVTFQFPGFPDPLTGPFPSFSLSQGFGSARLASGMLFQGPLAGQTTVQYSVQVRRADGSLVIGKDPAIEPLGPPPKPEE